MGFGHWIMRRASEFLKIPAAGLLAVALLGLTPIHASYASTSAKPPAPASGSAACKKPLYLTFDTGHMGVAPLIAKVLKQHEVPVTFFAAHEKTQEGDGSLGAHWAAWWKERGAESHDFASHTFDHAYWRADLDGNRFKIRPSAGLQTGQDLNWGATDYCENLKKASQRLEALTGRVSLPLFRAPGGKTSPALIQAAASCGYAHVGWSPAGFLGDELSSQTHSNANLLKNSLKNIRSGDILVAHLGIWSRQDPWAPAVLEPLIVGLKEKGFCFDSLRQHPQYAKLLADIPKTPK
jgi:peptidoglycan/xylan/chitin deacetylase (PgdA/CDA1 family)